MQVGSGLASAYVNVGTVGRTGTAAQDSREVPLPVASRDQAGCWGTHDNVHAGTLAVDPAGYMSRDLCFASARSAVGLFTVPLGDVVMVRNSVVRVLDLTLRPTKASNFQHARTS